MNKAVALKNPEISPLTAGRDNILLLNYSHFGELQRMRRKFYNTEVREVNRPSSRHLML
jgi:hypothetical protein